jgi:hypothetical protein
MAGFALTLEAGAFPISLGDSVLSRTIVANLAMLKRNSLKHGMLHTLQFGPNKLCPRDAYALAQRLS